MCLAIPAKIVELVPDTVAWPRSRSVACAVALISDCSKMTCRNRATGCSFMSASP